MFGLCPRNRSRLILGHYDGGEDGDRLAKSLVNCHDAILVLDGDRSVVAAEAEVGDNISPIRLVITESNGAEYPRAVELVAVMLGIKNAVLCGVVLIDLGILRVEVIDRGKKTSPARSKRCAALWTAANIHGFAICSA